MDIEANDLFLERVYHWENVRGDKVYMTQPLGGGAVREYTWAQTVDEARRMAAHLQSLNYEPGSRIAILAKNTAHFMISDLAIWMAGHVSVALYPTLNAETVAYILEHSESKLLFIGKLDVWDDMKAGVPADLPQIKFPLAPPVECPDWEDIISKTEPIEGSPVRDADDMAILVYTSGTTGRPKGVAHSFRTMAEPSTGFQQVLAFTPEDRAISYLPLAHVFERAAIEAGSFTSGMQVFFAESLDTFVQDLNRARPTVFHSVPRLWLKFQLGVFAKMPPEKLNFLLRIPIVSGLVKKKVLKGLGLDQARMAISGSAPIPPELIEWYQGLGLELLEGYAMSENFAYSHISLPGKSRSGYVGHALPGVKVKISDEGEILVQSPGSMLEYYKQPELTAEAFAEERFLKTGDRGEIDADGRLKITGRVKELFKTSKGKYVAPAPIENIINSSTLVEQSCVAGSGHDKAHAVVMLSEEARKADRAAVEAGLKSLLGAVNGKIESFEELGFLAVVDDEWLIENDFLTPTMKIKRNVIESTYAPNLETWYGAKKPVVWQSA